MGAWLSAHEAFPDRVNAGFAQIENSRSLHLRVIERGVGETRTVIDSFVVDVDDDGNAVPAEGSAIMMSRQMHSFHEVAGPDLAKTEHLSAAVRALTTFPLFAFMSIATSSSINV